MFRRGRGVPGRSRSSSTTEGRLAPRPDVEMYPEYPEYLRRVGLPFRCEFIDIGSDLCEEEIRAMDVVSMHTLLVMRYVFDAAKLGVPPGGAETAAPRSGGGRFTLEPHLRIFGELPNRSRGRSTWIITGTHREVLRDALHSRGDGDGGRGAHREGLVRRRAGRPATTPEAARKGARGRARGRARGKDARKRLAAKLP